VFWDEMLLAGTAVNVAAALLAMLLFSVEAPVALATAIYFAPLPLNCFLAVSVWRSAASASQATAFAVRFAAVAWLLAATAL
jgi:hypothetical protein